MAKITIEDCLEKIGNHFQLVLIAGRRARQLQGGAPPKIEETNEKPSIIALREIAAGLVDEEIFNEPLATDANAEAELAELINHEMMNQNMSRTLNDPDEDEPDNAESKISITELSPETVDPTEAFGNDANLDHLTDDTPPDIEATNDALEKKLNESENAVADKLLSKAFGEPETEANGNSGKES